MKPSFRKLILGTAASMGMWVSGCATDGDRPLSKIDRVCKEYCQKRPKEIFALTHATFDSDNNAWGSSSQGSLYIQRPDGLLYAPGKAEGLNPDCFATAPIFEEAPDLRDKDLTWENTTIMFINFNKDGRLESRELTPTSSSKSARVIDSIDAALADGNSNYKNDYKIVMKQLTGLHMTVSFPTPNTPNTSSGLPSAEHIDEEGFRAMDLNSVPSDKTPFFKRFGIKNGAGVKDHAFFYVLLDAQLEFNRAGGHLPYAPGNLGQYYTPYLEYPIEPLSATNSKNRAEVMPVYFYRGGDMAAADNIQRDEKCVYPYDIGIIAAGQIGFPHKTPLFVDPETETQGPIP